jgi:predicted nuclease with RNAse H fold
MPDIEDDSLCHLNMSRARSPTVVAGIDVGGPRKGFHAIALRNKDILGKFSCTDAREVANWCAQVGATVVAVDAPISWSRSGRARPAERALMEAGISCFSTPTGKIARRHPTRHYAWMQNCARLYRALARHFRPFDGRNAGRRPIVFETFPHAIACALAGEIVSARNKRAVRRALLADAGVACDALTNIDFVDAALCAWAADLFARRRFGKHGDPVEGYIVVPRGC